MAIPVLAAVLIGGSLAPAMAGGHAVVVSATADEKDDSLKLSVTTGGDISRFPDALANSALVFGYAWVDVDSGKVILATIHPQIPHDSNQNPDAWHIHPGLVGAGTINSTFCVLSLGTAQGGLSIKGDTMRLNVETSQAGVTLAELDVAVGFKVFADAGCVATGLGSELTGPFVGFS